jgi:hypothetical protein
MFDPLFYLFRVCNQLILEYAMQGSQFGHEILKYFMKLKVHFSGETKFEFSMKKLLVGLYLAPC